jgi:ribosome-binding ATPase YchF (GTP1/OBG family)
MKCLLKKKRNAVYDKNREVKELATDNPYLSSVVSDYDSIQGTVLEEKKTQKSALKILSKHIRDISENMKHDEFQLDRIREDQLVLMEEIEKLRKDIRYIHNKIDQGSSHIIRQNPVNRNRRYDYVDDEELEEEPSDSYSSDYDSSDDSSEGEYVYNGRY